MAKLTNFILQVSPKVKKVFQLFRLRQINKDRYLNIREHMALMGLPHDYKVDDTVIKG